MKDALPVVGRCFGCDDLPVYVCKCLVLLIATICYMQAGDIDDSNLEKLDVKSLHKAHAFFAGTRLLQFSATSRTNELKSIEEGDDAEGEPAAAGAGASENKSDERQIEPEATVQIPPDGGALCYCLRTG